MPSVSIGLSLRGQLNNSVYSPNKLFASSEPGVWYDPSDLTTLFQDNLGTTPVTAPNQPVGLMLDKSQGLVLGPELVTNGDFSNGTTGWAVSGGTAVVTSGQVVVTSSGGAAYFTQSFTTVIGRTYKVTGNIVAAPGNPSFVGIRKNDDAGATINTSLIRSGVGAASAIFVATATTSFIILQINGSGFPATFDNISVKLLPGNHATQGTAGQRPTYQVDSTGHPYLSFDGVDDGMVTGTITPAIDKVQVFAGVQKLSDAAQKFVVEFSATIASNNGAFALTAPNSAAANYNFSSKGTTQTNNVVTTYTAPITSVISGLGDIAGASNLVRVNGAQVGSVLTTQGTGNFLAYPLYIGRRGGTTLPYNGRLYSLIIRFGANLTDGQITSTESYVNSKTGAY